MNEEDGILRKVEKQIWSERGGGASYTTMLVTFPWEENPVTKHASDGERQESHHATTDSKDSVAGGAEYVPC